MHTVKKILDLFIEISFFLILLIFSFSYLQISLKQHLIFIPLLLFISIKLFSKINLAKIEFWIIFLAVVMMFVFDFSEKVDFIQKFNISIEENKRVPLSTIVLSFALLSFLIKIQIDGKFMISNHPFAIYFIMSGIFLSLLLSIFFPILMVKYQLGIESYLHLLNKILKYSCILLLTTNYLNNDDKIKRLNIGIIASLGFIIITTLLRII